MKLQRTEYLSVLFVFILCGPAFAVGTWTYYAELGPAGRQAPVSILEDKNGAKWVAIQHGVSRFYHGSWETIIEDEPYITGMVIDHAGRILVSTMEKIYRLERNTWESATELPPSGGGLWIESMVMSPDGMLWVHHDFPVFHNPSRGWYGYDGNDWHKGSIADGFPIDDPWILKSGRDGSFWAVSWIGLSRYKDGKWGHFPFRENGMPQISVYDLSVNSHGTAFFATDSGIIKFQEGAFSYLTTQKVRNIAAEDSGVLWCLPDPPDSCLIKFDQETWTRYSPPIEMYSSGWRYSLFMDSENSLWIGSGNGLLRFNPSFTTHAGETPATPSAVAVTGNSPNPFNPSTTISFSLPQSGQAELSVYSITGQKVRTLLSGQISAGTHTANWNGKADDGSAVASGVYIVYLRSGKTVATHRMALMR